MSTTHASPESEPELLQAGWTRRFVAGPARLKEVVALYESLGLEVHLEQLDPAGLDDDCQGCALALALFRVVYTRPR
ncbi:MAG: hypothetical protein HGA45_19260 [Chloroflexales bacterium]|nr:hypothetical protein [Chloroflexales bacterium]